MCGIVFTLRSEDHVAWDVGKCQGHPVSNLDFESHLWVDLDSLRTNNECSFISEQFILKTKNEKCAYVRKEGNVILPREQSFYEIPYRL